MVQIVTDSTADLSRGLVEQYHIQVIPLYVNLNGKTYRDGVDIHLPDLFQMVEKTGQLPKTSAPTVADFIEVFQQAEESIYIGLSGRLSTTQQNAHLARQALPTHGIYIVDSQNLSCGLGLLVLWAAELRDQGLAASDIAHQLNARVSCARTSFMIETLDYLYKGGRCSAMQNLMGALLHIRPIIAVRPDGTLGIKGKTRGARQKGMQFLLDTFTEDLPAVDRRRIFVAYTTGEADAEFLRQEILKAAPDSTVLTTIAGSVIASHCGPETIGICYLLN